ncbi:MAG: hypothetical protein BWX93_00437 [Bacteroidetes bacterium ADurb.Bin139]|nr:MAG: hypothetical protein BWX93_00437 [Bacteroidetes bacterium ADurb.Bin139]
MPVKYTRRIHCTIRAMTTDPFEGSITVAVIPSGIVSICPCCSFSPNQTRGSKDPGAQKGSNRESGMISSHTIRLNL